MWPAEWSVLAYEGNGLPREATNRGRTGEPILIFVRGVGVEGG